ncbi:MAG: hypothetical protein Tsb009_21800 [Planctomycetaceae bacterium]
MIPEKSDTIYYSKFTAVFTSLLFVGLVAASPADDKKSPSKEELKKQQQAFEAFAKPGKPHRELRKLVGRWKGEVTMYDPSDPKNGIMSKSTGTAIFRPLMGGRFVQQVWRGKMAGQPFVGMGISGYDNSKKKYVSTWIDNFGTGIMNSTGTYDEKTKTITEIGTASTPQGDLKLKTIIKYTDADHFQLTMFMVSPKGSHKMMEIQYTRDKSFKPPQRKKRVKKAK